MEGDRPEKRNTLQGGPGDGPPTHMNNDGPDSGAPNAREFWARLIEVAALDFSAGKYGSPRAYMGVIFVLFILFPFRIGRRKKRGYMRRMLNLMAHLVFILVTSALLALLASAYIMDRFHDSATIVLYLAADIFMTAALVL